MYCWSEKVFELSVPLALDGKSRGSNQWPLDCKANMLQMHSYITLLEHGTCTCTSSKLHCHKLHVYRNDPKFSERHISVGIPHPYLWSARLTYGNVNFLRLSRFFSQRNKDTVMILGAWHHHSCIAISCMYTIMILSFLTDMLVLAFPSKSVIRKVNLMLTFCV